MPLLVPGPLACPAQAQKVQAAILAVEALAAVVVVVQDVGVFGAGAVKMPAAGA